MNIDPPSMHSTTSGSICVFSSRFTLLYLLLHTHEISHGNVFRYEEKQPEYLVPLDFIHI